MGYFAGLLFHRHIKSGYIISFTEKQFNEINQEMGLGRETGLI
jgi:hypothetical protein